MTFSQGLKSLSDDLRNPTLVSFLDLARWVAAAGVFLAHLRIPLFLGYADVESGSRNLLVKLWYFATGLQTEAVIVFFVLSGLLVAGAGAARVSRSTFDVRSYSIDRITRLYLAFLPALLLCYGLDCYGASNFSEIGYWNHTHPMIAEKVLAEPFADHLSPTLLLENALMLQTFWVVPVGSNHPLWTISVEFWFYVVFGIAAIAWMTRRAGRAIALGLLLGVFLFLGVKFPVLLGYWLIGMGIAIVPGTKWLHPVIALAGFLVILAAVRLGRFEFDGSPLIKTMKNFTVAVSFAIVIVSMRGKSYCVFEKTGKLNRFLANFSYSLYLIHFPLMLFLLALLSARFGLDEIATGYSPTSGEGLSIYVGMIVTVCVLAWGFSRLTEAHTKTVRRYIKSAIGFNP